MFNSCYVKDILFYVVSVVQKDVKNFQVCKIATDMLFIHFKKNLHILERKEVSTFNLKKGYQQKRRNRKGGREEGRKGGQKNCSFQTAAW